ncbi:hypothetical protein [Massilia antarctica]|uniref:hypothetical protein n=1 Tax=Massilia antarctica TaxID=2765360 RepID=UPI00226D7A89|nr:hypothetical protein [Massilia sp. H27-R4]MCY0913220.1 hypothetical protein [Massilia sp. H27-R4]
MKPQVSPAQAPRRIPAELRLRVLELRRAHTLRQVAELTDLPLGTVKTLCSRSGAFRDNEQHRALFTLPPIKLSTNTGVSVPDLPPREVITGDKEIDAVLWLHSVIRTGQADLISKAMEAAKRIKTPLKELEKRYRDHIVRTKPGNMFAALSTFGFCDLEDMAKSAVEKMARQKEAHARFGDDVFGFTPAEQFCEDTLVDVGLCKNSWSLDAKQVDSRFGAHPALRPHTLADCLHELSYWSELFTLRYAFGTSAGDPGTNIQAREDYTFRLLAKIRARAPAEAVAVFQYMAKRELMDRAETDDILLNLLGKRN